MSLGRCVRDQAHGNISAANTAAAAAAQAEAERARQGHELLRLRQELAAVQAAAQRVGDRLRMQAFKHELLVFSFQNDLVGVLCPSIAEGRDTFTAQLGCAARPVLACRKLALAPSGSSCACQPSGSLTSRAALGHCHRCRCCRCWHCDGQWLTAAVCATGPATSPLHFIPAGLHKRPA